MQSILLEIISTSPQDSKTIWEYGANRIQLVSALEIGGLTPSKALLRKSLQISGIPTMVMVRHHNQGFVLDAEERDLLIEQAISVVEMGSRGIVIGAITEDSKVDEQLLIKLRSQFSENKVDITFHKAADYTANLIEAYQTLRKYGINRVLTQGGQGKIEENGVIIRELLAYDGVKTLIGGGINFDNIQSIVLGLHPSQIHIGTCVRSNRFGPVQGKLVQKFIQKLSK